MLLWWILGAILIGGILVVTISGLITRGKVSDHLTSSGYTNAKIVSLLPDESITVEAFRNGCKETIKYTSEDGVDSSLYVGKQF